MSSFTTYNELRDALKLHGSALMELLSLQMRASGSYLSRQLSFSQVVMHNVSIELTSEECDIYNKCVLTMRHNSFIAGSGPQSFFQRLITGIKTKHAIKLARECLAKENSVIISLVNTGESSFTKDTKTDVSSNKCIGKEDVEK